MKSSLILFIAVMLGTLSAIARPTTVAALQAIPSPDHVESEKAVREVLYETSLAAQSGDVAKFKKHAAQRTLGLYDLIFSELATTPKIKEQLSQAGVTSGEKLLESGLHAVAKRAAAVPAEKLQEYAHEQAAIPLTFNSDKEATGQTKGGAIKIVLEKGEWKVDLTETLKKTLVQLLPLGADSKAKIDKY